MRQRCRLHARAAFVLTSAFFLFAVVQLITAIVIECLLPNVRDAEYAAKRNRLQALLAAQPQRPLVLFLGSSRTLMVFRAADIQTPVTAFNFGLRGAGPVLQLAFLRRLLDEGVRPNLLLVEVLPPLFNQPGPHPLEETWLHGSRLCLSEIDALQPFHSRRGRLLRHWLGGRWAPWSASRRELRGLLGDPFPEPTHADGDPVPSEMDAHGWQPYFEHGVTPDQYTRFWDVARQQYHDAFGPFRLSARATQALESLLDLCHGNKIPVVLVLTPEGSAFRNLYPWAVQEGVDRYLNAVARQRGLRVLDARGWVEDADFWDGHHALPAGAAAFTKRLDEEVLRRVQEKICSWPAEPVRNQ